LNSKIGIYIEKKTENKRKIGKMGLGSILRFRPTLPIPLARPTPFLPLFFFFFFHRDTDMWDRHVIPVVLARTPTDPPRVVTSPLAGTSPWDRIALTGRCSRIVGPAPQPQTPAHQQRPAPDAPARCRVHLAAASAARIGRNHLALPQLIPPNRR